MRPSREIFVDDLQIVVIIDFVARQNAELIARLEECERDHQVTGELEGVRLCEGNIVRHLSGSIRERANPARWLIKRLGPGRDHRTGRAKRPQLASGPPEG